MTEVDRSMVGTLSEPFYVEVEKGAIRKFADAIGDPNPLYRDERYARHHGYGSIVAPPTFPTSFRPPRELPWIEHLDKRRIVAGQMSFEYFRPIVAGMKFECRFRLADVEEKAGTRGRMELLHQEMQGREILADGTVGELVFVAGRTTIYRSAAQIEQRSLA